ncbi:citron-like protein [Blyttiomyces helicus]|uniref:Citron-like protein n=1 Tax=Blyttiomyces helicus TaxID=388810 RepID=A0A4V1IQE0_9FUNG|nr:citron-like protein [Blyttiomyces helicus]|eukprot:RKO86227.1 citron-like protein [Blyttiomyces helicus]
MKETKECEFYSLARTRASMYLCVAMSKSIMVLKWAPHPFNKFMKLKEIPIDQKIGCMDIAESSSGELRLYAGTQTSFRAIDLGSLAVEEVAFTGMGMDRLGVCVKGIMFEDSFVICYQNIGVITHADGGRENKTLTWRNPLNFAAKLGTDFLVAGSSSVVDVINRESGKIVHVFETKKDKIRALELLVCRGDKLFLLAEEEKDGMKTSSIILIELLVKDEPV